MATTVPGDGMTTITIDQDTREELRYLLDRDSTELMDFNLQVGDGNREAAHRGFEIAQLVCGLLDDIGWAAEDDRASYEVTVAPDRLVPWLRRLRGEIDERRSLRTIDDLLDRLSGHAAVA
jgi:hypothetical protein